MLSPSSPPPASSSACSPSKLVLLVGLAFAALSLGGCSGTGGYAQVRTAQTRRSPGKVLLVASSASMQRLADGTSRPTGVFLNELYEPYSALLDAGYTVTLATPQGARPAIDPEGLAPRYWRSPAVRAQALTFARLSPDWQTPLRIAAARERSDEWEGIVVPGGQGVMVDLLDDPDLPSLLASMGSSGRPVGLICHAPALLLRGQPNARLLPGAAVTSVSRTEEWFIETFVMGAKAETRGIGASLEAAGYAFEAALPGRPHAVRDCNLVTSQNPFSGEAFSRHYLAALADYRRGVRCVPRVSAAR